MTTNAPYPNDAKRFVQSLCEDDLRDLIVVPLLEQMQYRRVQVTHGPTELGKDIVFKNTSPLDSEEYCAIVLKATRITGDVNSSTAARNVLFQLRQAFDTPILSSDGTPQRIRKVYVITSYTISQTAITSISGELPRMNVTFIGVEQLLELIQSYLSEVFEGAPSTLYAYLKKCHESNVHIKNLSILGSSKQVRLNDAYTGGALVFREENIFAAGKPVTIADAMSSHRHLLVCGGLGSGKSTLLQKQLLDLVTENEIRPKSTVSNLPILLNLKYLTRKDVRNKQAFSTALDDAIGKMGMHGVDVRTNTQVEAVTLFLDGVDEMELDVRERFGSVVAQLSKDRPFGKEVRNIIVTSRTYAMATIGNFTTAFLCPFGLQEVKSFGRKWFDDDELAARFVEFVRNRPDVSTLCTSPLLLTLVAGIYENDVHDFPAGRTAIYEKALQVLISRWDMERQVIERLNEDMAWRFLMYLAGEMTTRGRYDADDDLTEYVARELEKEGLKCFLPRTAIAVEKLFQRTGLLNVAEHGHLEFVHKSVREYLAARHFASVQEEGTIRKNANKEEWWNVTVFFCGIVARFDRLAKETINAIGKTPVLLAECVMEARRTPISYRNEILDSFLSRVAAGRISLTDEGVAFLRSLGDAVIQRIESVLASIEVSNRSPRSFLLSVVDILSKRNDRKSVQSLKRLHTHLVKITFSREQLAAVLISLMTGRNSVAAAVFEELYFVKGDGEVALAVLVEVEREGADRYKQGCLGVVRRDCEWFQLLRNLVIEGAGTRRSGQSASESAEVARVGQFIRKGVLSPWALLDVIRFGRERQVGHEIIGSIVEMIARGKRSSKAYGKQCEDVLDELDKLVAFRIRGVEQVAESERKTPVPKWIEMEMEVVSGRGQKRLKHIEQIYRQVAGKTQNLDRSYKERIRELQEAKFNFKTGALKSTEMAFVNWIRAEVVGMDGGLGDGLERLEEMYTRRLSGEVDELGVERLRQVEQVLKSGYVSEGTGRRPKTPEWLESDMDSVSGDLERRRKRVAKVYGGLADKLVDVRKEQRKVGGKGRGTKRGTKRVAK